MMRFASGAGLGLVLVACAGAQPAQHAAPAPTPSAVVTAAPPPAAPVAQKAQPVFGKATKDEVATPPSDAERTQSGLATQKLAVGTGTAHPGASDRVKVHFAGWLKDGTPFDSSLGEEPGEFIVSQVIPGWSETLQLMVVGEKRRAWIPASLAFGETPQSPDSPPGPLTVDVELIDIVVVPPPPPAPEDVAAPPATAKKTKTGLAYRVLKPGTGAKPKATSLVTVHYTGWTTDGKAFDSSIPRGEPTSFPLDRVIPGWTEGVQLMKVGEKTRFWIPAKLAYGEHPQGGAPAGMLVFDVELLDVKEIASLGAAGPAK